MSQPARLALSNVPAVIDPATDVIELEEHLSAGRRRWTHLYRLQLGHDSPLPTQTVGQNNLFGTSEDFADCTVLLCYGIDGYIRAVYVLNETNEWVEMSLGEEASGRSPLAPSVRFYLASPRQATRVHQLWERLRAELVSAAAAGCTSEKFVDVMPHDAMFELAALLVSSSVPPRVLHVRLSSAEIGKGS